MNVWRERKIYVLRSGVWTIRIIQVENVDEWGWEAMASFTDVITSWDHGLTFASADEAKASAEQWLKERTK